MALEEGPTLRTYVETRFNLLDEKLSATRSHYDAVLDERDRRYQERHLSNQAALDKVAEEMTAKFASVNEFRGAMGDAQRQFMPRAEAEALFAGLESKIAQQFTQLDRLQSERAGIKGGYGYAVGVVGLVLTVAALITAVMRFGQ